MLGVQNGVASPCIVSHAHFDELGGNGVHRPSWEGRSSCVLYIVDVSRSDGWFEVAWPVDALC